jgi:RNA polymerase sigma factor (sigma-70 family)
MNLAYTTSVADEGTIIEKILHGEVALFEVLIRRYNGVLYKIARSYGFNHQDAEDLMQETHITAFNKLETFQHKASYKTWVSKILMHKCVYKLSYGYFSKEALNTEYGENATPIFSNKTMATDKMVFNKELSKVLEKSLQQIPLTYRTVFILREIEGFTVQETAELLNITPVNVKVRLNRAKSLLQKELESYYCAADIYEFNDVYCTRIVHKVFEVLNKPSTI